MMRVKKAKINLPMRIDSPAREIALVDFGPIEDLRDRWLRNLDRAPTTLKSYRYRFDAFAPILRTKGTAIAREDVIAWKAQLLEKHEPSSVNQYLAAIRSFFKFLESEKMFPDITAGLRSCPVSSDVLRGVLDADELRRFFHAVALRDGIQCLRDFALFNLLLRCGLRIVEIVRSVVGDFKEQQGRWVLYVQGKGRAAKDQFVILPDAAYRPLLTYWQARRPCPGDPNMRPAFDCMRRPGDVLKTRAIQRLWKIYAGKAGISASTHWLRHTFATKALSAGADLMHVKDALRHAQVNTTAKYLHLDRFRGAAEDAVDEALRRDLGENGQ